MEEGPFLPQKKRKFSLATHFVKKEKDHLSIESTTLSPSLFSFEHTHTRLRRKKHFSFSLRFLSPHGLIYDGLRCSESENELSHFSSFFGLIFRPRGCACLL